MQPMPSVPVDDLDDPDAQAESEPQAGAVAAEAFRLQDQTLAWSRSLAELKSATPEDSDDAVTILHAAIQAVEAEVQRMDKSEKAERDSASRLLEAARQLKEVIEALIATLETDLAPASGTPGAPDPGASGAPGSGTPAAPAGGSPAAPDSWTPMATVSGAQTGPVSWSPVAFASGPQTAPETATLPAAAPGSPPEPARS